MRLGATCGNISVKRKIDQESFSCCGRKSTMKDVRNDVVACIFAFISLLPVFTRSSLTEVTSETFGNNLNGVIAAFGDFNADKSADIFIITNGGKVIHDDYPIYSYA